MKMNLRIRQSELELKDENNEEDKREKTKTE